MKRLFFFLTLFFMTVVLQAQVSKTLNVTAGGLSAALTAEEKNSVTNLTLTGTIDARDFKTMRDDMPLLAEIDLLYVEIVGYIGTEGPYSTGNMSYPARGIPERAFYNGMTGVGKTSLTSIILPSTITTIESSAFSSCYGLKNVTLPASLVSISGQAFYNCSSLSSVNIPSQVSYIGIYVFVGIKDSIIVDNNNSYYSSQEGILFDKNKSVLKQCPTSKAGAYSIPVSVTTIEGLAFQACYNLTAVNIPSSVKEIPYAIFINCYSLKSVTIPSSVTTIGNWAFAGCNSLNSVTLPPNLTTIGEYAFNYCRNLTIINIPSTVTSIKKYAFAYCSGLTSITSLCLVPVNISSMPEVFLSVDKTACILNVPFGSKNLYEVADQWKDFTNIVEMPGLNLSANSLNFGPIGGTSDITLTSSAAWTAISDQAWLTINPASGIAGKDTLHITATSNQTATRSATVTISAEGLESQTIVVTQSGRIEVTAGNLKTLLSGQLTTITSLSLTGTMDARDFKTMRDDMPLLADIDLSGVTIAAYTGTEGTLPSSMGSVNYSSNAVPDNAFYNSASGIPKTSIISIILPESLNQIGGYAFYRCSGISSFSIPPFTNTIGSYAFEKCSGLVSIEIPSSVTLIGSSTFRNFNGLINVSHDNPKYSSVDGVLYNKNKSVIIQCPVSIQDSFLIPNTVNTIGTYAVSFCNNLTSARIPASVSIIENNAFINCERITTIHIPNSVQFIGSYAFHGCIKVDSIYSDLVVPVDLSNSTYVFYGIDKVTTKLIVPFGSKSTYQAASQWKDFSNILEMPGIFLSNHDLGMGASAGSANIMIASSAAWTVVSDQGWLTINPASGTAGMDTLSVTAASNTGNARSATITVSAEGLESQTIVVTQSGKIEVSAGNLKTLLAGQLSALTSLSLTGTMDARDFRTMRDDMPLLAEIDLSGVTIIAYTGNEGTSIQGGNNYPANSIPEFAFLDANWKGKNSLVTISLPESLVGIGKYSFTNCHGLTSLIIPPAVTSIGSSAISSCCSKIPSIFIPSSVTVIGSGAFTSFSGLITVDDNNPNYSSENGVLFNKVKTVLIQFPTSLKGNYDIPSTVTEIGSFAFFGCSGLTSVHFPKNLVSIRAAAFASCSTISSINIPSSVSIIERDAFSRCTSLNSIVVNSLIPINLSSSSNVFMEVNKITCALNVPLGSKSTYQAASQWKDFTNILEMPGIFLSNHDLGMGASAGSAKIMIASSAAWTAVSDQGWLTINPASGTAGMDTLSVTAASNTGNARSATITVSAEGLESQTIVVTQSGKIEVSAGNLKTLLAGQLSALTSLSLTGTIDARDFRTMRDDMPLLAEIDLSNVTIVAYTGSDGTYGTNNYAYPAGAIPMYAFCNSTTWVSKISLTTIILPTSATSIESSAFYACSNLINVILPASLVSIKGFAFYRCTKLGPIFISSLVTSIGGSVFVGINGNITVDVNNPYYSSLDGVLFDKGKSKIIQCPTSRTGSYSVPGTVNTIDDSAFELCKDLTDITFSSAITTFPRTAFYNCYNLTSVTFPPTVTTIGDWAFGGCYNLVDFTITSSVETIGAYAFYGCSDLTSVNIPISVKTIGGNAFNGCTGLTSIISALIIPVNLNSVLEVFKYINKTTCSLFVPYGSRSKYQAASQWQDFTNIIEMPGIYLSTNSLNFGSSAGTSEITLTSSAAWTAVSDQGWLTINPASGTAGMDTLSVTAASNTGNARSATITVSAEGLESQTIVVTQSGKIEVSAGNLKTLLAGQLSTLTSLSLTGTIDARDFRTMRDDMPLLAEIDLSNVTIVAYTGTEGTYTTSLRTYPANTIPEYAFYNSGTSQSKTTLKSFVLPISATSIGNSAFYVCSGLSSITLNSSLLSVGSSAFFNCTGLPSVRIPGLVNSIGNYAFRGCSAIITVDNDNPEFSSIDGVLFNKRKTVLIQCPVSITDQYTIPSTVTSIGTYAFYNCTGISLINSPSSLTSIGNNAFYNCSGLVGVNMSSALITIGSYAFGNCLSLIDIEIPITVTTIGSYAFYRCLNLNAIYAYTTVPVDLNSSSSVFYNVNKTTTTLYVSYGTRDLYMAANQWKEFTNIVEMKGFKLSTNSITLGAEQGSADTIFILSDVTWSVTCEENWLSVSPATGTGNDMLVFTAEQNTYPLPRITKVILTAHEVATQQIIVNQLFNAQPLTGTKTINPSGGDFKSFTEAITMLNYNGVGPGGVTFLVADGTSFHEADLNIQTNSSSLSNPVVFQKEGAGTNPVIYGMKIGGTAMDYILRISGSDCITFDGIDLASDPGFTSDGDKIEAGYYIPHNSNTDGSHHITIKNCKISISRKTVPDNVYGIFMAQNATSIGGIHSDILIDNVRFTDGRVPVSIAGSNIYNQNVEVRNCKFGEAETIIEPGDNYYLIQISYCKNISFHNNEITNISGPDFMAVYMSNFSGQNAIFNNRIHGLRGTRTDESSDLIGLYLSSNDITASMDVYNNLIYDLDGAKNTSTYTVNPYWNIQMVFLSGTAKFRVFNNTVAGGSVNSHENTILCWATTNTELKNNIFADFSIPGTFSVRSLFLSGNLFENNVFWIDEALTNNFTYRNLYKFKEWQKGTMKPSSGYFLMNVLADPNFRDRGNFDFTLLNPTPASGNGQPVGFITTDLNGAPRDLTRPDCGAYEGNFGPVADHYPPVIRFQPVPDNSSEVIKVTAEITDNVKVTNALIWFREKGSDGMFTSISGAPYGSVWEFTWPELTPGTYEYFICAKDPSGNTGSNGYMVSGLDASVTGLLVNNPPANPDYAYSFSNKTVQPALYHCTVGTGGTFESLTRPGGLFDVINSTVINANMEATIISDLDETGEIALQQWREAGPGNYSLTIKSGDGNLKTISNSGSNPIGFNGADRITIDGSYNGDGLNHLKFTTSGNTYGLYFNTPEVQGCNGISVKYCDFNTQSNICICNSGNNHSDFVLDHVKTIQGSYGIFLGNVSKLRITGCQVGNSDINNSITNYGIYLYTCSDFRLDGNILQNVKNSNSSLIAGIYLSSVSGGTISNNKVVNVQNLSTTLTNRSNGIYGVGCRNLEVYNNIISGINGTGYNSTSYSYGIRGVVWYSCTGIRFRHNTVNLYGTGNTASGAVCFTMSVESTYNSEFSNNIFSNTISNSGTSYTNGILLSSREFSNVFRNNINYVGGAKANYPFRINETGYMNLPAWRSFGFAPGDGRDLGSGLGDPKFRGSDPDDVTLQSASPALNSGLPSDITTDFSGNPRSLTAPDIGAIEEGSLPITMDIIPPVISYVPFQNLQNTTPEFSATITDNTVVSGAKMWYRLKGSNDVFTGVSGEKQEDQITWNFRVAVPLISGSEYEYFICAKDASENIITNGIANVALDAGSVGLAVNNPAAGPAYVRSFKITDLSISLGEISGSPFYVTYTSGASVNIPFTATSHFTSNVFEACLSDANGSFATETVIGSIASDDSGTISATIPPSLNGYGFRIRVRSTSPAVIYSNASKLIQIIFDNVLPSAELFVTQTTPVSAPFTAIIRFNETVVGFDLQKITGSNCTLSNLTETVPGQQYTVLVTPVGGGNVTLQLEADQVTDLAGNPNGASNQLTLYYIDTAAPKLNISAAIPGNLLDRSSVGLTFTFSEDITGFTSGDIVISNGGISGFAADNTFPNRIFTASLVPLIQGPVKVTVPAGVAVNAYMVGNSTSTLDLFYVINTVTQSISFKTGWNIFSVNNLPANPDMLAIFQPLINSGCLIKVQDESGNSLEDFGFFGGWQNNIGDISVNEGYKVKLNSSCQLTVEGTPVTFPIQIALSTGWNIISFPGLSEADAMMVVQQLIDRGTLIKVQDESGNSIEDFGFFGGWQNNIGNFKPGKGYKVKVTTNETLTIYEAYPKSSASPMSHEALVHFIPAITGNGVDHMNINLVDIPLDVLQNGDEIAVFDGETCVGGIKLTVAGCRLSVISLAASAKDDVPEKGFTEGNPFTLKLWKASINQEYLVKPEILKGSSTFLKHESALISLKNLTARQLGVLASWRETDLNGIRIFPNPTTGKVFIQFSEEFPVGTVVSVVNAIGQEVLNRKVDANPEVIDLAGHVSGMYQIRIITGNSTKTEKIILK